MITLIHGEDLASSRKKLQEERERLEKAEVKAEVVFLDGGKLKLSDLALVCQTTSIFSSQKLVIIENLLIGKADKEKQAIFQYLARDDCGVAILLWEGSQIDKTTLKKYLPKAREILCQPSKLLFRFLESLGGCSGSSLITSFHNVLAQEEPELVFAMMLRQLKQLILVKDMREKATAALPSWQVYKLRQQANFFSLTQLISLYRQAVAIDYKIKTGQTPFSLVALLDIFFLSL